MKVLRAEWIKLTSVKSPIWCAILVVVIGVAMAGLIGWVARTSRANADQFGGQTIPFGIGDALSGVSGLGTMVLMVLGALAITSEYRFGLIRTTFQALPRRTTVLIGKAVVYGLFGAVVSAVAAGGAILVARMVAGSEFAPDLSFDAPGAWRELYGVPIVAFLAVVLAVGVGALLRQSAAAIAVLLLWSLLVESLVPLFGSVGREITPFLPFVNANHFLGMTSTIEFHWGPWGSLLYFAAVVLVIGAAAAALVERRDA
ncbi:ABC transporter permease [Millisia brevis]|uniref:ABC transporter permease n=1 Tax=Millisia brevis TaxID=264148 RepID=UPI0008354B9B|nr:ABC transporter permease [Millisia brevis]